MIIMRIATWNVERLKHEKLIHQIQQACNDIDADFFVLTESDTRIQLEYPYVYYSDIPLGSPKSRYKESERRIAIYSKEPANQRCATFDGESSLCMEFDTAYGSILVYGTIMGIYGNREHTFLPDVKKQMADIRRLSETGKSIFVCGDFNLSFSDNYYFTKEGRKAVEAAFHECGITIATKDMPETIDHIAVSDEILRQRRIAVREWNEDKSLSDHKGIMIDILSRLANHQ